MCTKKFSARPLSEPPAHYKFERKAGDPVKGNRRKSNRSMTGLGGSSAPSAFTAQEAVLKPPKPTALPRSKGPEVKDRDVLKGLEIAMAAILDEDVYSWIKEALGTSVRHFLADLAALNGLGPSTLADAAWMKAASRRREVGRLEGMKKREGVGLDYPATL